MRATPVTFCHTHNVSYVHWDFEYARMVPKDNHARGVTIVESESLRVDIILFLKLDPKVIFDSSDRRRLSNDFKRSRSSCHRN